MEMMDKKVEQLKELLTEAEHAVVFIGSRMQHENGYPSLQESDWAYDMELKYGDSPEEIFNTSFYSTRKERFFDFYRDELLQMDYEPNEAYLALGKLEEQGKVKTEITNGIFSLATRAGCSNVIEMHGSIYDNYCGHCRKKYPLEFVKDSKKVPLCTECHSAVRPGVFLYGEMLDNQTMTRAMEEISEADLLVICGENLNDPSVENCLKYFKGDKVVVISDDSNHCNEKAFLLIKDKVTNVLPKLV